MSNFRQNRSIVEHFWTIKRTLLGPCVISCCLLLYWGPGEQLIPITANAILHVQGGDWKNWLQARAPGYCRTLALG